MKNGINTSEFWLIVAVIAADVANAVASALGVHFSLSSQQVLAAANAIAPIYATLRTFLKAKFPQVDLPEMNVADIAPPAPANSPTTPGYAAQTVPTPVGTVTLNPPDPSAAAAASAPGDPAAVASAT